MIEVEVLGPVRTILDGRPVTIGSRRQRAIIAALAVAEGRTVTVDALIDILWDDRLPADPRGGLQTYISRLRALLGDEVILHEANGYRLNDAEAGTDVQRVAARRQSARQVRDASPSEAARLLDEALAVWRGPALADFAASDAFMPDIAHFEEMRRAITDDAFEAHLDAGDRDVVADVERAAAAEPLRERTHLLLMRALHDVGRSAEALRVADRFRHDLVETTGLDPSPNLARTEQLIAAGEPLVTTSPRAEPVRIGRDPPRRPSVCLPRVGRFVGRRSELARLAEAVDRPGVVSIVGPGGVGKTRLAAEVLANGGANATVIELGALGDSADVVPALAAALGLRFSGEDLLAAVVELLSVEDHTIVLDNCEHVLAAVRDVAARVVTMCPDVRLLTTSRVRLGLAAEQTIVVTPLDRVDAVELYIDRVRGSAPTIAIEQHGHVIDRLCARLDDMPLALELAAAQTASLGVDALHERIDRALTLLRSSTPSADPRRADLGAVVEWSYGLLDADGRNLLEALAVFDGGFDVRGVEDVGRLVTVEDPLVALGELVDASLVVVDHTPTTPRYRILETVRSFAAERLNARGTATTVREAHARHVAARITTLARQACGPDEMVAWRAMNDERGNVRAALHHVASTEDLVSVGGRVALALARVALYRADVELLGLIRSVAEVPTAAGRPDPLGLAAASRAASLQGDLSAAQALAEAALGEGPDDGSAIARHTLGMVHLYRGDHGEAERWWSSTLDADGTTPADRADALAGIALARTYAGDHTGAEAACWALDVEVELVDAPTYRAFAAYVRGELLAVHDPRAAAEELRGATESSRAHGAEFVTGLASTALVAQLVRQGDAAAAFDELARLIELWRTTATWPQLWTTLRLTAELLNDHDEHESAGLLLEAADHDPAAPAVVGVDAARNQRVREAVRRNVGEEAWRGIVRTAGALPRAKIVDRAIASVQRAVAAGDADPAPRGPHPTPRAGGPREAPLPNRDGTSTGYG